MKKFLAAFSCAIALAFSIVVPAEKTAAFAESAETSVYERIGAYLSQAAELAHLPALSAIIVDEEGVLLSEQYGKGATADTPFLLGSVSKSFTAACVMTLVEEGKVELDAPIARYLPAARDGDRITVRGLLNHTGGLGEHQTLKNYKVTGEQGKHLYANVNYALLGKIIEAVSGKSYEAFVTERIFTPLGMTSSSASKEGSDGKLVQGHRNFFGFSVPSQPFYPKDENGWIQPAAGYLSSSAADMGRYLQAYLRGGEGVLSKESINAMFYEGVAVDAEYPYSYGFGWTLMREPFKEPVLRHSGLVETGMACIYLLPERGIGVALLANTNDYFVALDMMDRVGWSIPLVLTGMSVNEIGKNEFVLKHLGYDAIYLAVFVLSILPFFFIKRYKKRVEGKRFAVRIGSIVLLHAAAPVFLLLLSRLCFATPLWVARAFVPDFFLTVVLSAALLFVGGVCKTVVTLLSKKFVRS